MRNEQLEHIIRAAATVTGQDNIVIIGSQAILASYRHEQLPDEITKSVEADVFYLANNNEDLIDTIDGTIGEATSFQQLHGIYAHGVAEETAILPPGWKERLVTLENANTNGYTGLCLDPYDLCVSKLFRYEDKDLNYVDSLLSAGIINNKLLTQRAKTIIGHGDKKRLVIAYLEGIKDKPRPSVSSEMKRLKDIADRGDKVADQCNEHSKKTKEPT